MFDDVVFGKELTSYEKPKMLAAFMLKNDTHQVNVDVKLYNTNFVKNLNKYEVKDIQI